MNQAMMKREHDAEDDTTAKRVKESDRAVLEEMREKFARPSGPMDEELERAKHKYYVSYFKKVVERLPLSQNVIDVGEIPESHEGFLKIYSIAKTFVNAEIELKKLKAFNSIADVVSGTVGKFVHSKVVTPYLSRFVPPESLDYALNVYQDQLTCGETDSDLHCISYLIQNEIEKKEPLRIPDPKYNVFTQQLTALSRYVIEILKCAIRHNSSEAGMEFDRVEK